MSTRFAVAWDVFMAILAVVSILMVFWHAQGGIGRLSPDDLVMLDFLVIAIFAADWLFWLRKAPVKKLYVKRNWYDLLGMVPLYFSGVGFLRVFRMFRLFRVLRAVRVLNRLLGRLAVIAQRSKIAYLGAASAIITLGGSTLVWVIERETNPDLAEWGEAVWWGVVTVTTVGYGDITPVTTIGRVIAGLLMVTGIGTIAGLASQVSAALVHEGTEEDVDALTSLAALHDAGKLTDDEFSRAKQKVLE